MPPSKAIMFISRVVPQVQCSVPGVIGKKINAPLQAPHFEVSLSLHTKKRATHQTHWLNAPFLSGIPQTDCSGLQRGRDRFMPIEGFLPDQTLTELTVGLRQGDLCTASAPANAPGALAPSHLLSESPPFGCIVQGAD